MSTWFVIVCSCVIGSCLGYLVLLRSLLRHRNGPMWTALQVATAGELLRTASWVWRVFKYPAAYFEPEINMALILIGQGVTAFAVWFLVRRMRPEHHHGGTR